MRESRFLGFIGALGLVAWALWSQPAPAQGTAITSEPAPLSPFGNCNTTDHKGFDADEKFKNLGAAGPATFWVWMRSSDVGVVGA